MRGLCSDWLNTGQHRTGDLHGNGNNGNTTVMWMTNAGVTAEMVANTPIMLYFSAVLRPCHFARLANKLLKDEESAWDNYVLVCNFTKYLPIKKTIDSNKPFLILLLTTPPHVKCVSILPCNLSLMACFADINVSKGSVATYARCGGIFNIRLTTNLRRNLQVKII